MLSGKIILVEILKILKYRKYCQLVNKLNITAMTVYLTDNSSAILTLTMIFVAADM